MREGQWICENHQAKGVEEHIDGKGSYVMVCSYIISPKSSYLYRHRGNFWQHNFCLVLVSGVELQCQSLPLRFGVIYIDT